MAAEWDLDKTADSKMLNWEEESEFDEDEYNLNLAALGGVYDEFEVDDMCYDLFLGQLIKIIDNCDHTPTISEAFSLLSSKIKNDLDLIIVEEKFTYSKEELLDWLDQNPNKKVMLFARLFEGGYIEKWDALRYENLILTGKRGNYKVLDKDLRT